MTHKEHRTTDLWKELAPALRSYFLRHARRGSDPDDLLQECFLRVAEGIDRVVDEARIGAWVQGIARHLALDTLRDTSTVHTQKGTVELAESAAEEDLDQVIGGCIRAHIEGMETEDGALLRAFELDSVPQAEIARRFQLSTTAVKSRIRRARANIRKDILACCSLEFDRYGRVLDVRPLGESECGSCD